MKYLTLTILALVVASVLGGTYYSGYNAGKNKMINKYEDSILNRDGAYEFYVDSIYFTDPDYYFDVLIETDEYNEYMEKHGPWWNYL